MESQGATDANECMHKFSLKYTDTAFASCLPSEITRLLAEIVMVLNKLEDLREGFVKLCSTEQQGSNIGT
jgi:hypothetical protein